MLTDPFGPAEFNEHRIYQELNIRLISTEAGLTLDSRTRLEQGALEERGGIDWRLRIFVQLRASVNASNKIVAYTEPFFNLSEGPVQQGRLSVWRNFVGELIPISKNVEIVPGYLNQHVFRDRRDRSNHTANVNLPMRF